MSMFDDLLSQLHQSPASSRASGLADAFRSQETPPFGQMLSHLFGQSSGDQRASVLNSILSAIPAGIAQQFGIPAPNGRVTPGEAQQIPLEKVQDLAAKAEQHDPSIIDRVSEIYAQHPDLIKTLGVGALAIMANRMTRHA